MSSPYWGMTTQDYVMNEFELGFWWATDESSSMLHRFVKAVPGTVYDMSHNHWRRPRMAAVNTCTCSLDPWPHTYGKECKS